MLTINVSDEIKNSCPYFIGSTIFANVKNSQFNANLWNEINQFIEEYKKLHTIDDIKNHKSIKATRLSYKSLGKDPNRYRPSAESLCRRIIKEKLLHKVSTLVDLINFVSITSGYSISGFDIHKIKGNTLTLGVGKENEAYKGIGRGMINIEHLPVYRDSVGGIGTPTSDNERTKLDLNSSNILIIINSYSGNDELTQTNAMIINLLQKYTNATNIKAYEF